MWNNSYRTPTECWQKTSDFPKGKKLPRTCVGQKKKEKTETKEYGWDLHLWEGAVKEERFPHTRKPLHWWRQGLGWGGKLQSHGESATTGVQRAKQRDSCTEDRCQPALTAWEACLLSRWGGRGLGAEARASKVRSQGEDWGWLCEHSLKGDSVPQLARRESGKKSGPA